MTRSASQSGGRRTALVLGARGYLGVHIADALHDDGFAVIRASRQPEVSSGSVSLDVTARFSTLCTVLADVNPDVVVNCIGATNGAPAELVHGNVVVPQRLLEAVTLSSPQARFIHLGSAGEYGAATEPGQPVSEDAAENPVSAYGVSKLAGTRVLLGMAADRGQEAVVLRVFNPIGPGAPATSLPGRIARTLRTAVAAEPHDPIDTAPLDAYRDFVDVRDVAAAVVATANVATLGHRLYNVAGGAAVSTRTIVAMLVEEASFRGMVREGNPVSDRSGAVSWQQADISRASDDLGWRPRHELSSTIKELWRWMN